MEHKKFRSMENDNDPTIGKSLHWGPAKEISKAQEVEIEESLIYNKIRESKH